jgi:xylose isomerase
MDVSARALLIAEKMILDGRLDAHVGARYAGWSKPFGQQILSGQMALDQLAAQVLTRNQDTAPVSGRQEYLENLLNSYL